jgi:hypothetical protein
MAETQNYEPSGENRRRRLDAPRRLPPVVKVVSVAEPLDERLLEQFRIRSQGLSLPPVQPGFIRLLTHRFDGPAPVALTLFHAHLLAHDRTFAEWYAWMNRLEATHAESALEILHTNLRLRARFRGLVRRYRAAIAARNCIGETDLYTLEPIQARHQVRVIDLLQKRTYVFLYTTLEKTIQAALSYATYGIADPLAPKNPYTNMPWTLGQCISIFQQIAQIRTASHRFLSDDLIEFAKAGYAPRVYLRKRFHLLQIRAAETYFSDPTHPDTYYEYADVLDEIYDEYMVVRHDGHTLVRKLVLKRMLSPAYMAQWDAVVLAFWIWRNHSIWYRTSTIAWTSMNELLGAVEQLHRNSLFWWRTRPRRILARPPAPPAPPAEGPTVQIIEL